MGGRIEGATMNLKGAATVTVVFGQWHPYGIGHGDEEHIIIGIFATEEAAEAKVQEELAITGELRRHRVWRSTFLVQE